MTASLPSGSLLWNLVDAGARSLLMSAAVGAGLRVLRVSNVMARKLAWTLVLCGAMLMPVLAPWAENHAWVPMRAAVVPVQTWIKRIPTWTPAAASERAAPVRNIYPPRIEALPADDTQASAIDQGASAAPSIDRFPTSVVAVDGRNGISIENGTSLPRIRLTWGEIAFLFYASVAFVFLVRMGLGCLAAARLWMRATPVLDFAAASDGAKAIRWSREVASPVTVGSGILLPENYTSWDQEKLRIVLAHESSHVQQGDFYWQLCAALHAALFWFSPLGWWLKRTLCDLSEAISDRAAVSEAATHASYAQVLLEFAAMPRATRVGVAMARAGRLTDRIERLLDPGSFRRAFAGGRGRIAIAALLTPLALLAATSLRVQAAGQEPVPPAAPSMPAPQASAAPAVPAVPPAPGTPASPDVAPVAPAPELPPAAPDLVGETPVAPGPPSQPGRVGPPPGTRIVGGVSVGSGDSYSFSNSQSNSNSNSDSSSSSARRYSYSYARDGESYALVSGKDKGHVSFSGEWMEGREKEIDKARQIAHGDFLWFTRNGKSYVVDDPTIVSNLMALYKPMEELGRQQEELGRQQQELGRQQQELGEKMRQASIPTPDVSKEMAQLRAAMAELDAANGKTMTQQQLADLQGKLAELQGRLGGLQGEVGARQGDIGRLQGELGAKQGELGAQQGRLGAEQGRIAQEADRKVKFTIDESLRNGKARPVE